MTPMTATDPIPTAVQRCCDAWTKALAHKAIQENKLRDPLDLGCHIRSYAGQAYRNHLPFLSNPVQIDAFIACVAQGLALGAIEPELATKLLYAAQVAITSRRAQQQQQAAASRAAKQSTPHPPPHLEMGCPPDRSPKPQPEPSDLQMGCHPDRSPPRRTERRDLRLLLTQQPPHPLPPPGHQQLRQLR